MRVMSGKEQAALGENRFHCAFCDEVLPVDRFAKGAISEDLTVGIAQCGDCASFDEEHPGWDGYTGVDGDDIR